MTDTCGPTPAAGWAPGEVADWWGVTPPGAHNPWAGWKERVMTKSLATLKDVRDFFSTSDRPVTLAEMKALTKEDATELRELVTAAR